MFDPLSHTVTCYALWGMFAILCNLKKCLKMWAAHQEMQLLRHDSPLWLLPSAHLFLLPAIVVSFFFGAQALPHSPVWRFG